MKKSPEEVQARATFERLRNTLNAVEWHFLEPDGRVRHFPPGRLRMELLEAPNNKHDEWLFVAYMAHGDKPTWNHVKDNNGEWQSTSELRFKAMEWPISLNLEVRDFVSGSYGGMK